MNMKKILAAATASVVVVGTMAVVSMNSFAEVNANLWDNTAESWVAQNGSTVEVQAWQSVAYWLSSDDLETFDKAILTISNFGGLGDNSDSPATVYTWEPAEWATIISVGGQQYTVWEAVDEGFFNDDIDTITLEFTKDDLTGAGNEVQIQLCQSAATVSLEIVEKSVESSSTTSSEESDPESEPTSTPESEPESEPTSTPAESEPTSTPAESEPTSTPAESEPTSTPVESQPTESDDDKPSTPDATGADINESGTATDKVSSFGGINIKQIEQATAGFSADDPVTVTITAPEGVDTSEWQVAVIGFTTDWNGWQGVGSDPGVLTLKTTVGEVMAANKIDSLADLGGILAQVWHAGEKDEEISVEYTIKVGAKANASDDNTSGDNTSGDNTSGDNTSGDNTSGDDTSGDNTSGDNTSDDKTSGDNTSDDKTSDDSSAATGDESNAVTDGDSSAATGDDSTTVDPGATDDNGNGGNGGDGSNPGTGIALAVAPVILAAGAVTAIAIKKRK